MKVCVICLSSIKNKDDYYKVDLFLEGKLKGTDYAHKICWANKMNMDNQIKRMLNGLESQAKAIGIIPKEEVVSI